MKAPAFERHLARRSGQSHGHLFTNYYSNLTMVLQTTGISIHIYRASIITTFQSQVGLTEGGINSRTDNGAKRAGS